MWKTYTTVKNYIENPTNTLSKQVQFTLYQTVPSSHFSLTHRIYEVKIMATFAVI